MTMNQPTRKPARRGFTLIETALVVTVSGILMVTAVPKALTLRRQMELDTASRRFAQELKAAQHEAVRRNQNVTVTIEGDSAYTIGGAWGTRRIVLPQGITFHSSSPASMTFAAFGPVVGGGSNHFRLSNTSEIRTDVKVGSSGMITVARHDEAEPVIDGPVIDEPVVSEPVSDEPVISLPGLEPVTDPVTGTVTGTSTGTVLP